MSVADLTALIIAVTGVGGLVLSHKLGLLGQKKDEQQQAAANKLQERIASFDELESLNDRLEKENARLRTEASELRTLINEADARGDLRLAAQGRRCRETLDRTVAAMVTLQSVVVAEMAKVSAGDSLGKVEQHIAEDHPDETPDL